MANTETTINAVINPQINDALSAVNDDITDIQRHLPGESFRDTALRTMCRDVFLTSVNALAIYYKKMRNMQTMEVIIINEVLGF